jgi:hypothetical protein
MSNHTIDLFTSSATSIEDCIGRLEIRIPSLILMLDNKLKIDKKLLIPIYKDSSIFYNDENLSSIKDDKLKERIKKILPNLKILLNIVL